MTMATPDQFVRARTNEETIYRFLHEVINERQWDLIDELMTADVTFTTPRTAACGREKAKRAIREGVEAFDHLTAEMNHLVADDECAAVRFTVRGVHARVFAGVHPAHRRVTLPMVYVAEFEGGRIRNLETYYDLQLLLSEISCGSVLFLR